MGSFLETYNDPEVPTSSPGQVDFLAGQVTFKACLANGQESKQVIL